MALEVLKKELSPTTLTEEFRVRWGGIFCGSFVTAAFVFLFMLLGSIIGFPSIIAINPSVPESISATSLNEGPILWNWIYTLITQILSFFIGGYCSSRMAGVRRPAHAALYGLTVWAVVTVFVASLTASSSPYIEQLLAGNLSTTSSWLVFCILALGALFSALGGSAGRVTQQIGPPIVEGGRLKAAS